MKIALLTLVGLLCLAAAPDNPVVGRWAGRSPNPIGRTEEVEVRINATGSGLAGLLHTPDVEITLDKLHLDGRRFTFDAVRDFRGRKILYHYDGQVTADSIDFTVQNDDGSTFFRFLAHRVQESSDK